MHTIETLAIRKILGDLSKLQSQLTKLEGSAENRGDDSESEYTNPQTQNEILDLLLLLKSDWFASVAGYFINHRSASPYANLDDEYKVQDLIFCMASTIIPDLQYEDPQQKNTGALTSTRVDFFSAKCELFLETKMADSHHKAKQVEAEISEDLVKYGKQRTFNKLIFFVYCHHYIFPNRNEFEKGFTGSMSIQGHLIDTYCIVKP